MDTNSFVNKVRGKRVLFITTKNIDYIRNSQEVRLLSEHAECVEQICSVKKRYISRMIEVWGKVALYRMKNVDVIFVGFSPQLILPLFYWKLKKKIIIIDFFISVYDTLIHDRKKFKDKGVVAKLCHYIDRVTIRKANHIITDTKVDARYFIEEFQGTEDKFETLYLEADKTIYYPREQHKPAHLENKFVVLYFGSILPLQGVDVVLDAVRLLKEYEDIFFQIIGPIPEKYNKPLQENVEYIEWLSQEELAEYIANADLCFAGHFAGEIDKAKRTIPGKAYIYAAMEKKMILGDGVANHELFAESSVVKFVEMGNCQELAQKVLEFR